MSQDPPAGTSRRRYTAQFKKDLVERSLQPGASVSALALDNGINANVLFKWRRMHLRAAREHCTTPQAVLLPVSVTASQAPVPAMAKPAMPAPAAGVIEIDVSGVRVRVRGAVDVATLRCVLQALRGLA